MKTFLIIDGNSIMNRAFYGVMSKNMLATKSGIYTNAIYGFLNIYFMIKEKFNPDYVAVSFDLHAPTFRHKMYEEYKANRKSMPDELRMQMPYIKEIIKEMGIRIYEKEEYEADDIIGTISTKNTENGIFTYVLTGDKDSFQLISNTTSVIIPITKFGKTEYSVYTPELLKENKSISPEQVIEMKALMGDASDNIPGVKGIGEKTATSLILEYGSIDNIYKAIQENSHNFTAKILEKLVADKEMAYMSRTLATIDTNVLFDIVYDDTIDVNKEELYSLFRKLEFTKLMNKFDFSNIDTENIDSNLLNNTDINGSNLNNFDVEKAVNHVYILDTDIEQKTKKYADFLNKLNTKDSNFKVSYYTNISNSQDKILNKYFENTFFSIYFEATEEIYTHFIKSIDITYVKDSASLKFILDVLNSSALKLGYDIKKDLKTFFDLGVGDIKNFNYDLLLAYYLFESNKSSYDIEYIFSKIYDFDISIYSKKEVEQISLFDTTFEDTKNKFSSNDEKLISIILRGLYLSHEITLNRLEDLNMLKLYNEIEIPLTKTLASMESVGMYIDTEKLSEFDNTITENIRVLQDSIYVLAGETFNINSPQQLGKILFEKLELPTIKKNKTGYSTDKEVLEELIDKHDVIEKILEYRQLIKLKTTYVDGIREKLTNKNRIHTTFMQTVASTGRLSSIEPNLQNIPVRLEQGRKIRSFFATSDNHVIIDADYSQIELRILAHMSEDKTMIDAFLNDMDIHTVTASQVFDTDISEVTHEMRSKAKAVNFGIVYGISDFGLAKNIKTGVKEAGKYITNYLEKYSGIRNFMENIVVIAKEQGYISTLFNRIRYIPELSNKNKNIEQFGKRIAMNTPIQGTAADIIKIAMNKVYDEFKKNNLSSKLIMQVHDELIVEAPIEEKEIASKILKESMENVYKLSVPLKVDLNIGKNWYDTKD